MIDEFYRVKRLPPYVFAEVNRLKAEAASSMSFAKGRLIILEGDMELSVLQNAVPFYQPDQLSPVKAEDQQKPVD